MNVYELPNPSGEVLCVNCWCFLLICNMRRRCLCKNISSDFIIALGIILLLPYSNYMESNSDLTQVLSSISLPAGWTHWTIGWSHWKKHKILPCDLHKSHPASESSKVLSRISHRCWAPASICMPSVSSESAVVGGDQKHSGCTSGQGGSWWVSLNAGRQLLLR